MSPSEAGPEVPDLSGPDPALDTVEGVSTVLASLLPRLALVEDVEEGCHLLLDHALREDWVERAVVALHEGSTVRGAGCGVPEEGVRQFLERSADADSPYRELVEAGRETVIRHPSHFPELGFDGYIVLPLPSPRDSTGGLLVADHTDPDALGDLPELLTGCGPTLCRVLEREVRREGHRRLHRHASLLDTAIDILSDPVVLTDAENNFIYANRRADELFSASSDESEGRRRAIQINDLLFSSFLTEGVIGGEETASRELNLVDPSDGSDLLFEVISITLPTSVREDGAVVSVLRDITDLKKAVSELEVQFNRSRVAEQAARRESERLEAIIASVSDPILVTDPDSNIILTNAEAERLFEPDPEGDRESPRGRAVRANDTRVSSLLSEIVIRPEERSSETLDLTDPDRGEEFPAEVVSTKVTNRRGEVSAVVSVVHDLTQVVENKRLARELQVLNESLEERIRLATEELEERNRRLEWQSRELQKASRLKSEFLASMSHELRTPINAMLGYTSLLREEIYGELSPKQEQALEKIYGASQHLLALINDILDLSKIEAGKMPVTVDEVRIEPIVNELLQTVEPMVREKPVTLETELDGDLPLLRTDRTKVKQVLLNLITNAVKFTAEGHVLVRAFALDDDERIRIEVEDTGIGIEDDKLETIFQDFRQVDQSATRKYPGTGLGLSITSKLLSLLEGEVFVESEFGEGSTFSVEIPVRLEGGGAQGSQVSEVEPED